MFVRTKVTASSLEQVSTKAQSEIRANDIGKHFLYFHSDGNHFTWEVRRVISPPSRWSRLIGWLIPSRARQNEQQQKDYEAQQKTQELSMRSFLNVMNSGPGKGFERQLETALRNRRLDIGAVKEAVSLPDELRKRKERNLETFKSLLLLKINDSRGANPPQWLNQNIITDLAEQTLGSHVFDSPLKTRTINKAVSRADQLLKAMKKAEVASDQQALNYPKNAKPLLDKFKELMVEEGISEKELNELFNDTQAGNNVLKQIADMASYRVITDETITEIAQEVVENLRNSPATPRNISDILLFNSFPGNFPVQKR